MQMIQNKIKLYFKKKAVRAAAIKYSKVVRRNCCKMTHFLNLSDKYDKDLW